MNPPPAPITVEASTPRMLPKLTDANRSFWTGGQTGQLLIPWCESCHRWVPPPAAICPTCQQPTEAKPVSGRSTLYTWTVNAHQFHPDIPPPNLIALVVLDEQEDLRIATNLVGCEESDLRSGLPLTVMFEKHGDVYYPLFTPLGQE